MLSEFKCQNCWHRGAYERVDHFTSFDEATIKLIRDSGCSLLIPGAESGSQKIVDFLNKGFKVQGTLNFGNLCKKYDIAIRYDIMVGLPNETEEDFDATLKLIRKLYPLHKGNELSILFYTPYPGTYLYDLVSEKYGFKKPKSLEEWSEFDPGLIETKWINKRYKERLNKFLFYLQLTFMNEHYKRRVEQFPFIVKIAYKVMHRIALLRFNTNFFKLPLEKKLYNILKKIYIQKLFK